MKAQHDAIIVRNDVKTANRIISCWMITNGYVTGHGDTPDQMLGELALQSLKRGVEVRPEPQPLILDTAENDDTCNAIECMQLEIDDLSAEVCRWKNLLIEAERALNIATDFLSEARDHFNPSWDDGLSD